jgi:hypothetical protein
MFSSFPSPVQDQIKFYAVQPGYNDIDLSVTAFIASGILCCIIFPGYNTRL